MNGGVYFVFHKDKIPYHKKAYWLQSYFSKKFTNYRPIPTSNGFDEPHVPISLPQQPFTGPQLPYNEYALLNRAKINGMLSLLFFTF